MAAEEWPALLAATTAHTDAIGRVARQIERRWIRSGWQVGGLDGPAGAAVFFGYLVHADLYPGAGEMCDALIEGSLRAPMRRALSGIHHGLAGRSWAIQHLLGDDFEGAAEMFPRADRALLHLVTDPEQSRDWAFGSGTVGIASYALSRRSDPTCHEIAATVVRRLAAAAERTSDGIRWLTPPQVLPHWQRQSYPEGYHDLGVCNGIPGVLGFLARCVAADVEADRAQRLFDDGWSWLWAQRDASAHAPSQFPARLVAGRASPARPVRNGWCYGDIGVGACVLAMGQRLDRADVVDSGCQILRSAASRPIASWGVIDSSFCHGYAGIAHMLHRAYRSTADALFRDTAVQCYARVLSDLAVHEEGHHRRYAPRQRDPGEPANRLAWIDTDIGVAHGAAGVGLSLLAAVTTVAPDWDQAFLVDTIR